MLLLSGPRPFVLSESAVEEVTVHEKRTLGGDGETNYTCYSGEDKE